MIPKKNQIHIVYVYLNTCLCISCILVPSSYIHHFNMGSHHLKNKQKNCAYRTLIILNSGWKLHFFNNKAKLFRKKTKMEKFQSTPILFFTICAHLCIPYIFYIYLYIVHFIWLLYILHVRHQLIGLVHINMKCGCSIIIYWGG